MTSRRNFLVQTSAAFAAAGWSLPSAAQQRTFDPRPGAWRTFEVTTRVEVLDPKGITRLWLPVPSINTDWQRSLESSYSSNGQARMTSDAEEGARMLYVEFDAGEPQPVVEMTSRVQTRNRAVDWSARQPGAEDAESLRYWTRPTSLIPTGGIVRRTALKVIGDARTDEDKTRRIYDWVLANAWREPKVRGCGEGDIAAMLETGNLGGKCADINALFVGLCRSVGVPARDVYGLRLASSAFGYKELGGNPASLKGAQHCRAEVYLKAQGWVAMDPADVAKVMRQETSEWIKSTQHPLVAPVAKSLYGGWEGNWVGYNMAHDVKLANSKHAKLGFFMYPAAENSRGRIDSYAPDEFRYQITAREIV
ncbi:transglutaminase-like domain-containing protein [Caenimonas sp. SL110]|uniref:transglutaminase-like domain-containing protein n=1 Tax=Caenimonas sp. SL110 TaxID=1450524 RepID=UPI000652DE93|nr:transglutaminase domain-containing protein [Caenimonas sp. SL110]